MLEMRMSFALSSKSSLTESLEHVLTKEVEALLAEPRDETKAAERVHEARKSMKRLRALLRLYRGGLAHSLYSREDSALRELGRALARARDAVALRESLERLVLAAPA